MLAFTSGTTGKPKATMHFHRDVLAIADTFARHILRSTPDDRFAASPPLAFTFGLGQSVVFPLRCGAAVYLLEQPSPPRLLEAVERHGITVLATAPTAYRAMVPNLSEARVSSLRACVSAGETLPKATWEAVHDACGIDIIDGIGSTEMLHIFISAAAQEIRPGSTGRAVPGYLAEVQDPDGRPVADGERVGVRAAPDGNRQAAAVPAARKELRASKPALSIAIIGGGPAGLYLATLVKLLNPKHEIEVWERNAADDTFGFGVVFSDETLGGIEHADAAFYERLSQDFATWDDIDVHFRGQVLTSGGHGFAAISRQRLLAILRERCEQFGVTIHYREPAPRLAQLRGSHDRVVGADGVNSLTRAARAAVFRPELDVRRARYMWLGTPLVFEAFKFFIAETDIGVVQAHAYPYSDTLSTFIVELEEGSWTRSGQIDASERSWRPGESDEQGIAFCAEVFADALRGVPLLANNSRWIRFATLRTRCWRDGNLLLVGDAAHTAHFSIGSGTKLAMEDALALAACLHENPTVDAALVAYEAERRPVVESAQRAAQASLEWFENISQYTRQEPLQFAFNLLTRIRRVTYWNLKARDPEFVAEVDRWFNKGGDPVPPMFTPIRLRELELSNRVIVSPMDMYAAEDGLIGDFHLVHLGSKALGGAALVMTEMACVSREGRITPGCAGMYKPEHEAAFTRLVDFVHQQTPAKIGLQLGHS